MTVSPLAELSDGPDVVVIGAGAAGIAAARQLIAAELEVAVLEARHRVGGRAMTVRLKGHPVDLGAHWLHQGPINPLVALGRRRGEPLRRAPVDGHLFIAGQPGRRKDQAAFGRALALADRAMKHAAGSDDDRPVASVLPPMGPWGRRVTAIYELVSGRPLGEVSLHDVPDMEYSNNVFIAGGLGAYLARLASGLPVRSGTQVTTIDWSGPRVAVKSSAGTLKTRAALVTVPIAVLQKGGLRFTPELPPETLDAIHGFTPGIYEHVVLHWPSSPFRGPDRLATLIGTRHSPPGLLTSIDGTPFHFFELDTQAAEHLDKRDEHAPARFARAVLAEHFGSRAIRNLTVMRSTAWWHDPFSRASWAVVPPGRVEIRDRMKEPVGQRLWFAGEALSRAQWGTVGGAWEEGTRAADEILRALSSPGRRAS